MIIKKIFQEEESFKILKTLGLITNVEDYEKIYKNDWRKHESGIQIEKYRWNKKLVRWKNKPKWIKG